MGPGLEWCSLGSPAPVRPCDQIPTPRGNSLWYFCPQGKTTFLKFLLVWLLSAHQVVTLCDADSIYLFYHGVVYSRSSESLFVNVPKHKTLRYYPIWAPIDVDFLNREPPVRDDPNIWPVQASPPNPIRWQMWLKQLNGSLLGMPLWNRKDLVQGYALFSCLPSTRVRPLDRGLSLTILCFQFKVHPRLRKISN